MALTLMSAAENIGRGVVYCPPHVKKLDRFGGPGPYAPESYKNAREDGTIVSVNDTYVMVSYKGIVKATRPQDLEFLSSR